MSDGQSVLSNKQESHPEQLTGEKFLGYMNRAEFERLPWKTKREGQIVYADSGEIVPQGHRHAPEQRRFPAFAKRSEIEGARRTS